MIAEKIFSPRQYNLIQLAANLLLILIWFLSNEGLLFWDDFSYLNFAHQLNEGTFEITSNHFTSRVGVIYPTAWVINLLGINAYSMAVFPLLCALGLLNLFFFLGRLVNYWIGILGAFLLICDYHIINFAIHLFPEMPLALCVFGFLCGYYLLLKGEIDHRMAGLVCSLALLGAFLIKTTVFLLIPLIAFMFVNDRLQRRNRGFWLVFVTLSALVFVLHGLWYLEEKGSFFFRFKNIADNHVATVKTFFDKEELLWRRLTYLPLLTFTKGGFFIPLLVALPSILNLRKRSFSIQKAEQLWPVASLILIVSFWFFSTSWRYYSPLPLETRHIMFFVPVLIMAGITYWLGHPWFNWFGKKFVWLTGGLCLLAIPVFTIVKSGKRGFKDEEKLVRNFLVSNNSPQTIIADGLTSYGFPFFYYFRNVEDNYVWFSEMGNYSPQKGDYLLENKAYFNKEYEDGENYEQVKSKAKSLGLKLELISKEGHVKLFQFQ